MHERILLRDVNVKINDHIKCTDKPVGNDKLYIKIKSGVNQKAI